MPETNVTTAITEAMPITTPSRVSTERSLLAHSERSAIRMASAMFMGGRQTSGVGPQTLDVRLHTSLTANPPAWHSLSWDVEVRITQGRGPRSEVRGRRSDV